MLDLRDIGTDASTVSIISGGADYQLGLHAAQSTGGDIGRNSCILYLRTVGTVTAAINGTVRRRW